VKKFGLRKDPSFVSKAYPLSSARSLALRFNCHTSLSQALLCEVVRDSVVDGDVAAAGCVAHVWPITWCVMVIVTPSTRFPLRPFLITERGTVAKPDAGAEMEAAREC
jgi:hypothetical protein